MNLSIQQFKLPNGPLFVSEMPALGQGQVMMVGATPAALEMVRKAGAGASVFIARHLRGNLTNIGFFATAKEAMVAACSWMQTWAGDRALRDGELQSFIDEHVANPDAATTINSDRHLTLEPGCYPVESEFVTVARATVR